MAPPFDIKQNGDAASDRRPLTTEEDDYSQDELPSPMSRPRYLRYESVDICNI